ncbi:P2 family phage contractile tail tube protein [Sedimentibacter acidaminivorans]|uniref:P2 family phage contractile tail tube protein n=1 Tax=Sedimentibacter acidaminivorans TaxID=913099 RepID=A0ABS4GH24_9FIRM|nr:phage major tail tube protein [Sedimentibacter acidaminivorans]MBP1926847.1 P2 family phage contractile tail tube protein [Sedimentibacter acidaminivorans]
MKVRNKTINYNIYTKINNKANRILDTTEVTLPSIENGSDSIKGTGILGEIDLPNLYQPGSMTTIISFRGINESAAEMLVTDNLEIRWITDRFDTNGLKNGIDHHKAFLTVKLKKFDEGKVGSGESSDGSYEYEVLAYKRIMNGEELLHIDKLNSIFSVRGKNLLEDMNKYL